ncbi:MAG: serine/threonine-protein kinase [Zavarzinella sp.]
MDDITDEKRTLLVGMPGDQQGNSSVDELAPFRRYLQPGAPGSIGQISHFQIMKVVGQGGFGTVVLARDLKLDRLVAIKMLDPRLAVTSAPRKYFLREARCAAKISHPNVVQIFAVEESPTPYLVMEYIEGETLQDKLDREGPLPVDQGIEIGQQIAAGLEAAHQYGLIHRDIKPANIMIERSSNRVKITDFGVARTVDDASLTQSGAVVGTPMYMSPEQANGDPVDHRSDLFSLGSVLYTVLSGRPPFRANTQMAVLKRVVEDRPRCIKEVNPDLPDFVCQLVDRLHEKSPVQRFQTAKEVVDAIKNFHVVPKVVDDRAKRTPPWYLIPVCVAIICVSVVSVLLMGDRSPKVSANTEPSGVQPPNNFPEQHLPPPHPPFGPHPKMHLPPPPEHRGYHQEDFLEWKARVHKLPPMQQLEAVYKRLEDTNPGMNPKNLAVMQIYKDGIDRDAKVIEVRIRSSKIHDASPLQGFPHLKKLFIDPTPGEQSAITTLNSFRGMQVEQLELAYTKVDDLSPIADLPLVTLGIFGGNVQDLSPVRQMKSLKALHMNNHPFKSLEPLRGLPLEALSIWSFRGDTLEPLRGMPLTYLNAGDSLVTDLSPLEGMKLEFLCMNHAKVYDLEPLRGMPLKELLIQNTAVRDISVVKGMTLRKLACNDSPITDLSPAHGIPIRVLHANLEFPRDREFLLSLKVLESINEKTVQEFFTANQLK